MSDTFRTIIAGGGGDYTSVTAWEADTDNNLVATTTKEIGLISGIIPDNSVVIFGATVNSQYYRVLTYASGNKHQGTSGNQYAKIVTNANGVSLLWLDENYTQISGLQLSGSGTTFSFGINITNTSIPTGRLNIVIDSCIFTEFTDWGIVAGNSSHAPSATGLTIRNNLFFGHSNQTAIGMVGSGCQYEICNNTVFDCSPTSFYSFRIDGANTSSTVCNNVSVSGFKDFDIRNGAPNVLMSGNCSQDATASGSLAQTGLLPVNLFTSPQGAAPDLSIKNSNSNLYNAGVAIASFNYDILGTSRPQQSLWDVGAFEFIFVDTPPTIKMYTFIAGDITNQAFSGAVNINSGRFFVPVANVLPTPQKAGQAVLIPASGYLCIYNGVMWNTFGTGIIGPAWPGSGYPPDSPLVSSGLIWWGEPSGFVVDGATVSGVDTWINRAGISSTDLVSAGDSSNPFIASGFINGMNTLYFDGTNRFLQAATDYATAGADEDFTVFIVAKSTAISGNGDSTMISFNSSSDADTVHAMAFRNIPGSGFRSFRRSDAGGVDNVDFRITSAWDSNWNIWCVAFSGTQIALFKNGLQLASSGMNVGTLTPNLTTLGALAITGAENNYFVGHIAELAIYNSGMSNTGRTNIENYLSYKYSIALSR